VSFDPLDSHAFFSSSKLFGRARNLFATRRRSSAVVLPVVWPQGLLGIFNHGFTQTRELILFEECISIKNSQPHQKKDGISPAVPHDEKF